MSKYKLSYYTIDLVKDGYVADTKEGVTPVYNTLRGKFGYIPDDIDYDNPPEQLLKEGFIVPYNIDEPQQYKQAQIKAINDEYPSKVFLTICTTMRCNFNCAYCFEQGHRNADMSPETLADIITYIKNEIDRNPNLKVLRIKWFGGEPLLRMDVIREISNFVIPYCLSRNIQYSAEIITNGYLLTKEVSQELFDLSVKRAQIALDGFEQDYIATRQAPNDAFKRVLSNIENSAIPVVIRLNTTRTNMTKIIDLFEYLYNKFERNKENLNISISRVKDYGNSLTVGFTDKEWLTFRKRQTEFINKGCTGFIRIDRMGIIPCVNLQIRNVILCADGFIYRCENDVGFAKNSIGKINHGIDNILLNKKYCCSTINDNCMRCKYLPICCGGKCRYDEIHFGKSCELIKGRFKQNMQNYLMVNPM